MNEGTCILLCLRVARHRLDARGDACDAPRGIGDIRKRLAQVLRRRGVCSDPLKVRHDALDARRALREVRRHGIHVHEDAAQVAAILRRHLLQRRREPVEVRRDVLHVDGELHDGGLEARCAHDGVDGGEHLLHEDDHLVQLDEHRVHPHLIRAVEIVAVCVGVAVPVRRDDDEFIPHDAGLPDGDGGAARDLHPTLYDHGDGDARPVAHNILHMPDGHAREEHLCLRIQPDGAVKSRVQCVVAAAAEAQSAEEYDDSDQEDHASEGKRPHLCLCTHAPASLR